jgi:hypothetical protein
MLTYCNVDSFDHCIYSPIVTLTVSVIVYTHLNCQRYNRWAYIMTETVNVNIGEYIPWQNINGTIGEYMSWHKMSILQWVGVYHDETVNVTIGEYIPWPKLSTLQWRSIYHDRNDQCYNRWVYTMTYRWYSVMVYTHLC